MKGKIPDLMTLHPAWRHMNESISPEDWDKRREYVRIVWGVSSAALLISLASLFVHKSKTWRSKK